MFSQQDIFQPLDLSLTQFINNKEPLLLQNILIYQNIPVIAMLTQSHILLQQTQQSHCVYFCPLVFQVKFQVIRKPWQNQKQLGQSIGICLEKQQSKCKIQLFSHQQTIQHWTKGLEKKINQRNLHQLFKAKRKIGKGAFAAVYLTQRLQDGKQFAVKAFSKQKQFSGEKGRESLLNQIRIMRNLNNQNIMRLEGVFQTQNSIYLILQYLQGLPLYEQIKNKKTFTEKEIKIIIRSLLNGLNHLAENNVIHRDIKPENIMFRSNDCSKVVICDFGLATFAHQEKYLFVRCGTPGFVAPEIINIRDMNTKSHPVSDVFSVGLIFHYLLLNKPIFPGKQYADILSQNRRCEFDFNQQQYQAINSQTKDFLMRMLEKNPEKRISALEAMNHTYLLEKQMDIQQVRVEIQVVCCEIPDNKSKLFTDKINKIDQELTESSVKAFNKKINRKSMIMKKKQNNHCHHNNNNNNNNNIYLKQKKKVTLFKQNNQLQQLQQKYVVQNNKITHNRSKSRANKVMIDEKYEK